MEGWIKSYRAILENPIVCKDADHYAVWGYIMHHAAHAPMGTLFGGKRITLEPGQLITGRIKIAEFFKIDQNKVRRILKLFESEQQIEQQTTNSSTLISVINWREYQSGEQQIEQPLNNKRTTIEQPLNNKRTTSEQQVNTIKEYKNIKNTKNDNNVNNSHIHTDLFNLKTFMRARAKNFLSWLDENYPEVQNMEEPLTDDQAEEIAARYPFSDIERIVMAMDNKGATKNKSAYSTFIAFVSNDRILKDRKAVMCSVYTSEQVEEMVNSGKHKADAFILVRRGKGGVGWATKSSVLR